MIGDADLDEGQSTKADVLARALADQIFSGELAPGTALRQDTISRRFDVSRTPVREALRLLAARGLVTMVPNRGVRVRAPDPEEWRQAALARGALEGVLAELAAPRITADDLAELDRALADIDRHARALLAGPPPAGPPAGAGDGPLRAWGDANERFHAVIHRAAGAPVIEDLVATARLTFDRNARWHPGLAAEEMIAVDERQHRAIREALAAGSPEGARALASAHVLDSWRLLVRLQGGDAPA